jgi:N,N'-diacetyllegionaminate synthase
MIEINGRKIGKGEPAYVIAEIGINHDGNVDVAMRMVEEAARVGVDAVKVQLVDFEKDYAKGSKSYEVFKNVSLTMDEWLRVSDRAKECDIDMFASFARMEMIERSREFGFPAVKVSSGNMTNYPLLKAIAESKMPVIVSTGMSYLEEVVNCVGYLEKHGAENVAVLHCTSLYPTPPVDVNLRAMDTLLGALPNNVIGLSDHTTGITCSVAAVARGASIIEKHFTLDRSLPGSEHGFSLTVDELASLVLSVREVETILGSSTKAPVANEVPNRVKFRRTLIAVRDLKKGEILSVQNIIAKRSDVEGVGAEEFEKIIGKVILNDLSAGDPIKLELL